VSRHRRVYLRPRSYRLLRSLAVILGVGTIAVGAVVVFGGSRPAARNHRHPRVPGTTTSVVPPSTPVWRVAWGSGMAWGNGVASDVTVRDLVTVGVGGEAVRVRISNFFGDQPLAIGAATIGVSAAGPSIQPGTLLPLTFNGQSGVTIPVGQYVYSDPASLSVTDEETLAVSIFVSGTDLVSIHPCCTTMGPVSFFTPNGGGNLTGSVTGAGLSIASPFPRWIDAVDVLQTSGQGSIVVVGDSITDGYNATLSWTTVLQERIDTLPVSEQRAIVNEGITANALTSDVPTDEATGGGPSGLSRLAPDALDQSGVSEVVLFLGTNDLFFGDTAQQLITGYQQAIQAVHNSGVRIIGVTLLPRSSGVFRWTPVQQSELEQVNSWILSSGAFDGVLNLAVPVADIYNGACNASALFPPYDSGDHLHPNAAGQTAMANAVNPAILGLPAIPQVPPLVPVAPTPGCSADQLPASTSAAKSGDIEAWSQLVATTLMTGDRDDDRPAATT